MIRHITSAIGLISASLSGYTADVCARPIDLEIEVTITEFGPNGKSWDGVRVYLLPFEATTVTPPEPAICVYTDRGESACAPNVSTLASPCPDSFRCAFKVRIAEPFQYLTISVFDIDAFGRETGREVAQLIGQSLKSVEELVERDLSSEQIERGAIAVNERRWTWVETVSFQRSIADGERPERDVRSETLARQHAAMIVPPQLTAFDRGRIAAPFDLRPLGDCLYPMPACSYGYATVLIRSEALEEEMSGWD